MCACFEQLRLLVVAHLVEKFDGIFGEHPLADKRQVKADDFAHTAVDFNNLVNADRVNALNFTIIAVRD